MTEKALHPDVAEIVAELQIDNPEPRETWKSRGFWDPKFALAAIDRAERAGVIETRGDRGSDDYQFRFTAYGRRIASGGQPDIAAADGFKALERLKASGNPDAEAVSALVASLLEEIASRRDGTTAAPNSPASAVTGPLLEALREVANYRHGVYWWKQKSMQRLAAMGLVEAWHPDGGQTKRMAHRATPAGHELLAKSAR
jgi:hypothetical protein|nr:hypothetical protein [Neorhizobium tomejilense]